MGLVKTRRLAAMQKQQKAKAEMPKAKKKRKPVVIGVPIGYVKRHVAKGLPLSVVERRLRDDWDLDDALKTPLRVRKRSAPSAKTDAK